MTEARERKLPFLIVVALVVFLPLLGKGGLLASAIIGAALGAVIYKFIGTSNEA